MGPARFGRGPVTLSYARLVKTTPCIVLLVLSAVVGCGGGGGGPSKIAAKFADSDRNVDVNGAAFAIVAKGTQAFYVFAANTTPAPTCEMLSKLGALQQLTRGGFVTFTAAKVADGPGKVDVTEVSTLLGDMEKGDMFMNGGKVSSVSITLRTFDQKSFAGEVTTGAGAGTTASGPIAGTVCPPATFGEANGSAVGKVDPSASASTSTNDTTGMPPPPEPPPPEPPPATKPQGKPKPKPKTPKAPK